MTNMFAGDATTRLAPEGVVRAGRPAAQNNEASLVGGVVGLAQFMGPAAAAAGVSPAAAPTTGVGGMAGGAGVAPSTPVATGVASERGEQLPDEGVPTSIIAAAP
ncbi:MAG TPA: hypothetical protein VLQ65_07910, partial [Saliniramus sp.]|nr:hypothetical protein [Saliniramus sp.]